MFMSQINSILEKISRTTMSEKVRGTDFMVKSKGIIEIAASSTDVYSEILINFLNKAFDVTICKSILSLFYFAC